MNHNGQSWSYNKLGKASTYYNISVSAGQDSTSLDCKAKLRNYLHPTAEPWRTVVFLKAFLRSKERNILGQAYGQVGRAQTLTSIPGECSELMSSVRAHKAIPLPQCIHAGTLAAFSCRAEDLAAPSSALSHSQHPQNQALAKWVQCFAKECHAPFTLTPMSMCCMHLQSHNHNINDKQAGVERRSE